MPTCPHEPLPWPRGRRKVRLSAKYISVRTPPPPLSAAEESWSRGVPGSAPAANTSRPSRRQTLWSSGSAFAAQPSGLSRAAGSSRGGSLVLPPRPGWRDLAGRCWHARPPAASAHQPTRHLSRARSALLIPWPTSLAPPLAPGALSACHGVHRPPVPRAGQTARPGNRKGQDHDRGSRQLRRQPHRPGRDLPLAWETCAAGDALLGICGIRCTSPLGVAQPLPAVLAIRQSQGLAMATSWSGPFWIGEGDLQGTSVSDGVETPPPVPPVALRRRDIGGTSRLRGCAVAASGGFGFGSAGAWRGWPLGQEPFRFPKATHRVHTRDRTR